MVRFILAENYLHPSDFQAIETDGSCLQCGTAALQAVPHDQYFMIQCTACESPAFTYKLTPAQVRGHTGTDLIDTVIWEQASDFLKMRQDVCPDCAGNMETEIRDLSGEPEAERLPTSLVTLSECQQCLRFMSVPITHAAAYHPESIVFHWKRGLDILATGVWEFHENLHTEQWTADHVDGPTGSYKVEFQHDSSSLRLYLDETAVVTKSERVRGKDHSASRS
ncbi:hypothetical protein SAMN05444422_11542 [Halobiforma haloterrestris]|uniref:DUF7351 domain-containing protein n=2 Tax=Natronobacterium haloterrestre TaxID=148448 RepID=A0A1I1L9L7_NATHA|nr:hypothetical protein SAMN05444422_11542 [Halobiforma haloterrestris]